MYHLKLPPAQSMKFDIHTRRWMIERFMKQKQKENEAIEAAKRKAKSGR